MYIALYSVWNKVKDLSLCSRQVALTNKSPLASLTIPRYKNSPPGRPHERKCFFYLRLCVVWEIRFFFSYSNGSIIVSFTVYLATLLQNNQTNTTNPANYTISMMRTMIDDGVGLGSFKSIQVANKSTVIEQGECILLAEENEYCMTSLLHA